MTKATEIGGARKLMEFGSEKLPFNELFTIFVLFHLAHKNLECINRLSDEDIDKFLIVARSVGTFARALDCSSSVKQPR